MHRRKVFVVGRGAIGKALSVFLAINNVDVTLVRGRGQQGDSRKETFEVSLNDGTVEKATVPVCSLDELDIIEGIVVLTNKSFGNVELATKLSRKISTSPIVLLQNGLGVERPFTDRGFQSIYRCVLFVTSQNLSETAVRFKPVSSCPVGIVSGVQAELDSIVETLTTAHWTFRAEKDIDTVIWRKAIINCAFNSICPLLDIDNGIFHRNEEALALARRVIAEGIKVAAVNGAVLDHEQVVENLLQISRSSDGQLISTLQDIRKGLPTEIETLNLEVVRLAEEKGIGDQVEVMKMLGELTRMKAALSMEKSDHKKPY